MWKALRYLYFRPPVFWSLRYLLRKKVEGRKTVFVMIHALSGGGAERVGTILASELTAYYHVVLLYREKRNDPFPISPEVDTMFVPSSWKPEKESGWFPRYIKALKKRQGACVSISLLYYMNALNVSSRANDKIICSERNNPTKNEYDVGRFDHIQLLYERADHVVFQSTTVRDLFNDKVKSHCSILPNPVGVTCLRKEKTKHRIINCARLVPQKNQAMLIRAFHTFLQSHPDYTLSIYGEGYLQEYLATLIKDLNLQDAITLEGKSSSIHSDIADAEFFVLSSDFEGLSNALLEAMMMGFPCISTDCEGSTDVIEHGKNGLLIQRGNEEELLAAMLLLADNDTYREQLGHEAIITAERFKRDKVAEKWAQLAEQN